MSLLRAKVRKTDTWWELSLLDFDIVADGENEEAMLKDLVHSLVCEYHLAVEAGRPPFVNLLKASSAAVSQSWDEGAKQFGKLDLPEKVSLALSMVGHMQSYQNIQLRATVEAKAA